MELEVKRQTYGPKATIGSLFINGERFCFTLEDVVRAEKIKGETAIPAGRYKVIVTPSNRFKRDMPLLVDVPEFEGIRIHSGNTSADTHGCVLLGRSRVNDDFIGESRQAFNEFFPKLQAALARGEECWITVG